MSLINFKIWKPKLESKETSLNKGGRGIDSPDSITSIVENLREIGITITRFDLCQARRFAIEYENLNELVQEENINWNKIRRNMVEKFGNFC